MEDSREQVVIINLNNVTNKNELQVLLKDSLDFPEEAIKLTSILEAFNTEYPMLKCKIVHK
ncbi:hypothetical protein [Listeria seeligeri]|uniref:hypothetical protein n=1 Tax=Listeria seeligeri TaxID=1640 RepID=UPI0022EAD1E0|nr:hypothetical protein [Listeria seeligeri]